MIALHRTGWKGGLPFLLLLALCGASLGQKPVLAQPPVTVSSPPATLQASLKPEEATIGDRITYTLTLAHSSGVTCTPPNMSRPIDGVTLVDTKTIGPKRKEGEIVEKKISTYQVDQTGTIEFPPLQTTCLLNGKEQQIETKGLTLKVQSLLSDKMKDIHGIKPLELPAFHLPFAFFLAAGLLLFALLAVVYWRARKKKGEKTSFAPILSPREEAEAALKKLEALGLLEKGESGKYYFILSEIFRRYLERRFHIPAVERTSEEIRRDLVPLHIGDEWKEEIRLFLNRSDLVKYAGALPRRSEIEQTTEGVRAFVTKTSLEPSAEEPEAAHVAV
jgi:hypothetical protein